MEDPFQKTQPQKPNSQSRIRKLLWLLGGIFIILLILGYWSYHQLFFNPVLSYVPVDSLFYAQIKNPLLIKNNEERILPLSVYYRLIDSNLGLEVGTAENQIIKNSLIFSVAALPQENYGEFDFVYFIKSLDQPTVAIIKKINHLDLKNNFYAVSSSPLALEKVKLVLTDKILSIKSKAKVKNLEGDQYNFYLDVRNLKKYLSDGNLALALLDNFLDSDIYIKIKRTGGLPEIKILTERSFESNNNFVRQMKKIPDNFLFYVSGIKLSDIFLLWTKVNPEIANSFNQTVAAFNAIYHFDIVESLAPLFSNQAEVVIFPKLENKAFGFDFIYLITKEKSELLPNLEKLINIILAQKKPYRQKKYLPDGSFVYELQAQPDVFVWQEETLGNQQKIRYIKEVDINFEMAYANILDQIVISSSKSLLESYWESRGVNLGSYLESCPAISQDHFILFNFATSGWPISQNFIVPAKIILQQNNESLQGCIF